MFEFKDNTEANVIAFRAYGKIEKDDYEKLIPIIEKTERDAGSIHLYLEVGDLTSITFEALMKDIATYFKHARNFNKVAVVGDDDNNEKTWSKLANPFISAEVKYFPIQQQKDAKEWIK